MIRLTSVVACALLHAAASAYTYSVAYAAVTHPTFATTTQSTALPTTGQVWIRIDDQSATSSITLTGRTDYLFSDTVVRAAGGAGCTDSTLRMELEGQVLIGYVVNAGEVYYLSAGLQSGPSPQTWIVRAVTKYSATTGTPPATYYYSQDPFKVSLDKQGYMMVPVDSRRTYGQPNSQGLIGPDANEPAQHVKFKGKAYKGGGFVGYIGKNEKDKSGEGRSQLYRLGSELGPNVVAGSLYLHSSHVPLPAKYQGSFDIHAYAPAASDAFLNTSIEQLNWANRWTIPRDDPQSTAQSLGSANVPAALGWMKLTCLPVERIVLAPETVDPNIPLWRYFDYAELGSLNPAVLYAQTSTVTGTISPATGWNTQP